jgi:hypothetical protein
VDINPDPVFLADFRGGQHAKTGLQNRLACLPDPKIGNLHPPTGSQAQKEVNSWRLFSDSIFGGLSTGTLAPSSEVGADGERGLLAQLLTCCKQPQLTPALSSLLLAPGSSRWAGYQLVDMRITSLPSHYQLNQLLATKGADLLHPPL